MPKCQFTTQYYDYEISDDIHFCCPEEPLASGFCIFHDEDYLHDKINNDEHKRKVLNRLKRKVNHAISNNESLLCIGFQLPDFIPSDLGIINKEFTKPVYFSSSKFFGKASFHRANFKEIAIFYEAEFRGQSIFYDAKFQGEADFSKTDFQTHVGFNNSEFYGKT